jgi:hypothetical protein
MSFFSGFLQESGYYYYKSSPSETIGNINSFGVAIGSLILLVKSLIEKNNMNIITNIIFFIMSITLIIIYFIKRNEIIEIYIKDEKPDETINKIYFSLSIIMGFIYFYFAIN